MRLTRKAGAQENGLRAAGSAGALVTLLLLSCTPPPFAFTISNSYTREMFSGRDLGARSIALFPLLAAGQTVSGPKFPSAEMAVAMRRTRPDLRFSDADSVKSVIAKRIAAELLDSVQALLFEGDVVQLQSREKFWRAVPADYLLVVRLRHGIDIRTFNRVSRRRIAVEAELWDCASMETALRFNLTGIADRAGYSDRAFLLDAFTAIGKALPAPAPGYDSKSW